MQLHHSALRNMTISVKTPAQSEIPLKFLIGSVCSNRFLAARISSLIDESRSISVLCWTSAMYKGLSARGQHNIVITLYHVKVAEDPK